MRQPLLLPDPEPLVERLGKEFFRMAPQRPGVYLMKDSLGKVLYVGKAKDLKQRLAHYRVANPDRMPRRQLRLVRQVTRIEFQFCPTDSAAVRRESKLLLSLKPKFNRAGVWPRPPRFIVWRSAAENLELDLVEIPETRWRRFGPVNGSAGVLFGSLCRLLQLALNPDLPVVELPAGWTQVSQSCPRIIHGPAAQVQAHLEQFFWENSDGLLLWLASRLTGRTHPFERASVNADMEALQSFCRTRNERTQTDYQLWLL